MTKFKTDYVQAIDRIYAGRVQKEKDESLIDSGLKVFFISLICKHVSNDEQHTPFKMFISKYINVVVRMIKESEETFMETISLFCDDMESTELHPEIKEAVKKYAKEHPEILVYNKYLG